MQINFVHILKSNVLSIFKNTKEPVSSWFQVVLHLVFWILLGLVSLSFTTRIYPWDKAIPISFMNISLLSGTVYLYIKIIIPRFFRQEKFIWFFLSLAGLAILSTVLNVILTNFIANEGVLDLGINPVKESLRERAIGRPIFAPTFFITLTLLFIATVFELSKAFLEKERQTAQLEKEKTTHELNFLRSQINPHFLFNALNNLHATVQLKPEKAGDYVLKLGAMLRYVLEDCKKEKVSLADEIKYLENYIFFQKQKDENLQNIRFEVSGNDPSGFHLEPMLFIALVENAFQHSYLENAKNQWVDIELKTTDRNICLVVKNNLNDYVKEEKESLGIGLKNIKRRLELLYPEKHELIYDKKDGYFLSSLTIRL